MQRKDLFVIVWETVLHLHTVSVNASLQGDKPQSRPSQPPHTRTSGLDRAYSVSTFSFRIQPLNFLFKTYKKWRFVVHSLKKNQQQQNKTKQNKTKKTQRTINRLKE